MEDLDPDAKRLLGLVSEARTPSAADKARVAGKIGAAIWLLETAATTSVAAQTVTKAGLGLGVKWAMGVMALAVVGGVSYGVYTPEPAREPSKPVVAHVTEARVPEPQTAPEMMEAEPSPPPPPAALKSARAERARPARAGKSTLGKELELLHGAQSSWRAGDASRALSQLEAHRRAYAHSQLWPERDALRVLCLCALGRTDEARKLGRRFLAAAPQSPLRSAVTESCVEH